MKVLEPVLEKFLRESADSSYAYEQMCYHTYDILIQRQGQNTTDAKYGEHHMFGDIETFVCAMDKTREVCARGGELILQE